MFSVNVLNVCNLNKWNSITATILWQKDNFTLQWNFFYLFYKALKIVTCCHTTLFTWKVYSWKMRWSEVLFLFFHHWKLKVKIFLIKLVSVEMKVNELHTLRKAKIKIKLNWDKWIFFYFVTNGTNWK